MGAACGGAMEEGVAEAAGSLGRFYLAKATAALAEGLIFNPGASRPLRSLGLRPAPCLPCQRVPAP